MYINLNHKQIKLVTVRNGIVVESTAEYIPMGLPTQLHRLHHPVMVLPPFLRIDAVKGASAK